MHLLALNMFFVSKEPEAVHFFYVCPHCPGHCPPLERKDKRISSKRTSFPFVFSSSAHFGPCRNHRQLFDPSLKSLNLCACQKARCILSIELFEISFYHLLSLMFCGFRHHYCIIQPAIFVFDSLKKSSLVSVILSLLLHPVLQSSTGTLCHLTSLLQLIIHVFFVWLL